jgi:hypothetical protein
MALFFVWGKETSHSSGMNNLIAGAKSEVEERWDWNTGEEVTLGNSIASVVHSFDWVGSQV